MKIGIEEEFIVVDPKTLFCNPGAFRLAANLVYKDSAYIHKCSVELPLHSGAMARILKQVGKAFSVFEIKTDPYEDVELLRDELLHHRKNLAEVAMDNNLMVLPTGLYPLYSLNTFFPDNCAALHVHVDYDKGVFDRLYEHIPFLISISTNSPFSDGQIKAMSNRLQNSPHVSIPSDVYRRSSDIIHNKHLNTVEIRVLDSQITIDDSIGLASIIKAIAENSEYKVKISRNEYILRRDKAISDGFQSISISSDEYTYLKEYDSNVKRMLKQKNGSDWQIQIYKKYGLSSVIVSLWESFRMNERTVRQSFQQINSDIIHLSNLFYFIPYAPFFFLDKYKKYHQDIASICKLATSLLR